MPSPRQLWPSVVEPLLDAVAPIRIALLLYDDDGLVPHIGEWTDRRVGVSVAVYGVPPQGGWGRASQLTFYSDRLPQDELDADVVVVASEPNYWTTRSALNLASARATAVVVCSTWWPHGRRDSYPPDTIVPRAQRHRAMRSALRTDGDPAAGAGLLEDWEHAVDELTPENGVRTAIDDHVLDVAGGWRLIDVPGLGGTTVLLRGASLATNESFGQLIEWFDSTDFLKAHIRRVEAVRLGAEGRLSSAEAAARHVENELERLRQQLEVLEAESTHGEELSAASENAQETERLRVELARAVAAEDELRQAAQNAQKESLASAAALQAAQEDAREAEISRDLLRSFAGEIQHDLDQTRTRTDELRGELESQTTTVAKARYELARCELRLAEAGETVAYLLRTISDAHGLVDAAARSRSWRVGHGISRIGRIVTFRRAVGTAGALDKARDTLAANLRPALPPGASDSAAADGDAAGVEIAPPPAGPRDGDAEHAR